MLSTRKKFPSFSRLSDNSHVRNKSDALIAASSDFCQLSRPKRAEIECFREQFYALVAYTDENSRREIAKNVAENEYVPRAILLFLAIDAPIVAAPVIAKSRTLGQLDLMQIIDKKGTVHHRVIANRADIGPSVVAKLIALGDRLVARRLLENKRATYSHEQRNELEIIANINETNDMVSIFDAVLDPNIGAIIEMEKILGNLKANAEENVVLENSKVVDGKITDQAVEELMSLTKRNVRPADYTEPARISAADFYRNFVDAASRNHRQDQMTALNEYFGFSMDTCTKIFADSYGDSLAIALKASDMAKSDAEGAIMLCMPNVGLSVQNMKRISAIYSQLETPACLAAVNSWEMDVPVRTPASSPQFQPLLADEDRRNNLRSEGVQPAQVISNVRETQKSA